MTNEKLLSIISGAKGDLTESQICEAAGLSIGAISAIRGGKTPALDRAGKLLDAVLGSNCMFARARDGSDHYMAVGPAPRLEMMARVPGADPDTRESSNPMSLETALQASEAASSSFTADYELALHLLGTVAVEHREGAFEYIMEMLLGREGYQPALDGDEQDCQS